MALLNKLMEICATLSKKVANLEQDKITQALKITKLKERVRRLEKKRGTKHSSLKRLKKVEPAKVEEVLEVVISSKLITEVVTTATPITIATKVPKLSTPRKRRGVVIQDLEETATTSVIMHSKNDVLGQVQRKERQDNAVMRYQALKRKHLTGDQARKNMMIYLKNMAGFKMDFFKEKEDEEVIVQEEESKRKGENIEQDTTKKQRIDEDVEELKTHLYIVFNDDDDVYTKATPLASKVLIVDYQIHHENNKTYYKIIRADRTHQLFLIFITLLKNFNREDLEVLWKLVKERFKSTKPKNFSDDFLLNTLKIIFEKPNVEAIV
nr:hypothetical protein [Tanacetum cinerariifolium]